MAEEAKGSGGKLAMIMDLLSKACWVIGFIALAVLLAGANGIGPDDVTMTLTNAAPITLGVFVAMIAVAAFAQMRTSGGQTDLVGDTCAALQSNVDAKCAEIDKKIQTYLGTEYDKLKADNETLRAALEEIKAEENEKIRSEVEELRNRNQELKEELTKVEIELSEKLKAAEQGSLTSLQEPEAVRASA